MNVVTQVQSSRVLRNFAVIGLLFFLGACSDDDTITTECGVVFEQELRNGLRTKHARHGHITAVDGRGFVTVVLDGDEGTVLVALHGLRNDIPAEKAIGAQRVLEAVLQSGNTGGYFIEARENCTIQIVGEDGFSAVATPGQFVLDNETSLSEVLLSATLGEINNRNTCDSDLIKSCYSGILLEAGNFPVPSVTPSPSPTATASRRAAL